MQPPAIPDDEEIRLAALRAYDVLDSPEERVFNDIVETISDICEVPIAAISLIDSDRQWFKASVGLDVNETPRDISFCGHAILEDEIFEISNATEDLRFSDNPLVTNAPNIRFYAGAQLINDKGIAIGTLCVIDNTPKRLNAMQKKALLALSHAIMVQLELRKSVEALRLKDQKISRQNRMLQAIQAIQSDYVTAIPTQRLFSDMLQNLLDITDSQFGFIGEVHKGDGGQPYLKTHAISNIAWNKETTAFFEQNAPNGLVFTNLNTLFGAVITSRAPVITNSPETDNRAGGLPEGHPTLNCFAGLPLSCGGNFIGMVGIANCPDGYVADLDAQLLPYLNSCAQIIVAYRAKERA